MRKYTLPIILLFLLLFSNIYAATNYLTPTTNIRLISFLGVDIPTEETCLDPSCGTPISSHPKKNSILSLFDETVAGLTNKKRYETINLGPNSIVCNINSLYSSSTGGVQILTCPGISTTNILTSLDVGQYFGKGYTLRNFTNSDTTYYNTKSISATSTAQFEATNGTPGFRYTYKVYLECYTKSFNSDGNLVQNTTPVSCSYINTTAGTASQDSGGCYITIFCYFGVPLSVYTINLTPTIAGNPYFVYNFLSTQLISVTPDN